MAVTVKHPDDSVTEFPSATGYVREDGGVSVVNGTTELGWFNVQHIVSVAVSE